MKSEELKEWPDTVDPGIGIGPVEIALIMGLRSAVERHADAAAAARRHHRCYVAEDAARIDSAADARALIAALIELGVDVSQYIDVEVFGMSGSGA